MIARSIFFVNNYAERRAACIQTVGVSLSLGVASRFANMVMPSIIRAKARPEDVSLLAAEIGMVAWSITGLSLFIACIAFAYACSIRQRPIQQAATQSVALRQVPELPTDASQLVRNIYATLDGIDPAVTGFVNERAYTAIAIRDEYLPKTLAAYSLIPKPGRAQYNATLIVQLQQLDAAATAIAQAVIIETAKSLDANGVFLSERLRDPDTYSTGDPQ